MKKSEIKNILQEIVETHIPVVYPSHVENASIEDLLAFIEQKLIKIALAEISISNQLHESLCHLELLSEEL